MQQAGMLTAIGIAFLLMLPPDQRNSTTHAYIASRTLQVILEIQSLTN
jgi:hypothetical protein